MGKISIQLKSCTFFEKQNGNEFFVTVDLNEQSAKSSVRLGEDGINVVWNEELSFSVDGVLNENSALVFKVYDSENADKFLGKNTLGNIVYFTDGKIENRKLLLENPGLFGELHVLVCTYDCAVPADSNEEPSSEPPPQVRERGFNFSFGEPIAAENEPAANSAAPVPAPSENEEIPVVRERSFDFGFGLGGEPAANSAAPVPPPSESEEIPVVRERSFDSGVGSGGEQAASPDAPAAPAPAPPEKDEEPQVRDRSFNTGIDEPTVPGPKEETEASPQETAEASPQETAEASPQETAEASPKEETEASPTSASSTPSASASSSSSSSSSSSPSLASLAVRKQALDAQVEAMNKQMDTMQAQIDAMNKQFEIMDQQLAAANK